MATLLEIAGVQKPEPQDKQIARIIAELIEEYLLNDPESFQELADLEHDRLTNR
jgi:hypothetical protein